MKKILLVGPLPPPLTGQSIGFHMLVEALKERGLPFDVVNLSGSENNLQGATFWRRFFDYIFIISIYLTRALVKEKTVYITISQSPRGFLRDLIMIFFARVRKHKIICHLKGGNYGIFYRSQPNYLKRLIRKTLLRANKILVLGERLKEMFSFDPRISEKVRVVPNGLPYDLKKFYSGKELPDTSLFPVRLLFLSNLVESKGYLDVLEAIKILKNEYNLNVECDFCGEFMKNRPDDKRVKGIEHAREIFNDYIVANGIEKNVTYKGVVSGKEKNKELEDAHIFVLPTNYNNEGQPISIIEAMAYGCVVISTDYRAIPDMVKNGKTGYLVRFGHSEEIARCVAELVETPTLYSKMSRAAINLFHCKFTREAHLKRILPFIAGDLEN